MVVGMACTLGFSAWQIRRAPALIAALSLWIVLASGGVIVATAATANCAGNPNALGTSRVLTVDMTTPRVGRKHFPVTLPLADKEVVLTFDDGPLPGPTNRILDTLKAECVRATFFLLGRMTAKSPELARRELADGHTVGHHSYNHPLLGHMNPDKAMADVDRGFAADDTALYGKTAGAPHTLLLHWFSPCLQAVPPLPQPQCYHTFLPAFCFGTAPPTPRPGRPPRSARGGTPPTPPRAPPRRTPWAPRRRRRA